MQQALAWTGAFVVLGAWCWPWWQPGLPCLVAGTVALALLATLARGRRAAVPALAAAAFLVGSAAPAGLPDPPEPDGHLTATVLTRTGRHAIVDTPEGRLRLTFPEEAAPRPGTRLAAWVRPEPTPVFLPGEPDPRIDDARAHVRRTRVRRWVRLGGPPPPSFDWSAARHGGILAALVSGDRGGIDEPTMNLLRDTGTAHLVAISGLHVGMLSGLAWWLVRSLSRLAAAGRAPRLVSVLPAIGATAVAFAYAWTAGWPVSAQRAACMVAFSVASTALGRTPHPWTLLGAAAWLVVGAEPSSVGELGFQLSFGAVAGILLVAPRALRYLPPDQPRPIRWLVGSLATTLGATLGTLPVTAWTFQQVCPASPLANLWAGPLFGIFAVPAAMLARALPGTPGGWALRVADGAVGLALGGLAWLDVAPWTPAVGPIGALLLALAVIARRRPIAGLTLAALGLGLRSAPVDQLVVTFLPIGQGDASLVEWPDGRRWLVDGGPSGSHVLQYLRRRGIRHLDAVFLSHDHPDHSGGLVPVVDELEVDRFWAPHPPTQPHGDYWQIWLDLQARGVPVSWPGEAGAAVVHPTDGWVATGRDRLNEESLVLAVMYGDQVALFAGDIGPQAEALLAHRLPDVDLLKVAHHGSRRSSSTAFLDAVRPEVAVISCGEGNSYGHPAPGTLFRLRASRVYRTDRDGAVTVSLDGEGMLVQVQRGPAKMTR